MRKIIQSLEEAEIKLKEAENVLKKLPDDWDKRYAELFLSLRDKQSSVLGRLQDCCTPLFTGGKSCLGKIPEGSVVFDPHPYFGGEKLRIGDNGMSTREIIRRGLFCAVSKLFLTKIEEATQESYQFLGVIKELKYLAGVRNKKASK